MYIYPVFQDRLFAPERPIYGVDYKVERYSKSAIGGSDKATISATGNQKNLFHLLERLNYGVELRDKWGDTVWTGYIGEIKLSVGVVEFSISLDRISNRIRVKYSTSSANGTVDGMTGWADNLKSQSLFGVRELTQSLNQTDEAAANNKRDTLLEILGVPVPRLGLSGQGGAVRGELTCFGWLYTMNNRYYQQTGGREQYIGNSPIEEGIAYSIYHHIAGQSFTLPSSQEVEYIHYYGGYHGDALYNIILKIHANGGDNYPGTTLVTLPAIAESSMLKDKFDWIKVKLSSPYTLSPSTTYWITWERDVAGDSTADYAYVGRQTDGSYANGKAVTWESNYLDPKWTDLGGDMSFIVEATEDNAEYIAYIALNACDYIEGVHTGASAGVRTPIYRKGDYKALQEILTLASQGTSNKRRLRLEVLRDRYLAIHEETAYNREKPDYYMDATGKLTGVNNKKAILHKCPVGVWVKLKDVLPAGLAVDRTDLIDHFYIEASEYSPANESLSYTPRGDTSTFDMSAFEPG